MKHIFNKIFLLTTFLVVVVDAKSYKSFDIKHKRHKTQKQKEELFKNVGCTYSNIMVIDPKVTMEPACETTYFHDHKDTILNLSGKYKKNVEDRTLAPMYLEFVSPIIGYGIRAIKPIKTGDFIGVYAGTLRNLCFNDPNFTEDVDYAWYYTIPNKNNEYMIIDGKYEGNELRFINHAQDPNTKRIDVILEDVFYVCYVACKDIAADEELTVSYGDGYWNSRGITPESLN